MFRNGFFLPRFSAGFSTDVNDWTVDTTNQNSIVLWASNATIKKLWASSIETYTNVAVGNTTIADYAYPRTCNHEVCDSSARARVEARWLAHGH
jgi:hypothetical protein